MIESQLIILQQAQIYLRTVTEQQYREVLKPYFISSAGAHIRHILDHYFAIIKGQSKGLIDYDKRSRGGEIESSPSAALLAIDEIIAYLTSLTTQQLQKTLKLSTEISVKDKLVAIADTTLMREVIFAGSHAVHHFAMIKQISQYQQLEVDENLGIAPATATFLRSNQN